MDDRRQHWETVYRTKSDDEVSWFEIAPDLSLRFLDEAGLTPHSWVVDIGGGVSRLVDALVGRGCACVTVADVSVTALERTKARLGEAADRVRWLVADVSDPGCAIGPSDLWHDRAVFHFLVDPADRAVYVEHLSRSLRRGGGAIFATFAPDGPERCSGLPVMRYSAAQLAAVLGPGFALVDSLRQEHHTPAGRIQAFQWSRFTRLL